MITQVNVARVEDIILDENHEDYGKFLGNDTIGIVRFVFLDEVSPQENKNNLLFAKPLFSSFTQYPTINELVYILGGPSPNYYSNSKTMAYYLPPMKIHSHPLHNAFPNQLERDTPRVSNDEILGGATQLSEQEYTLKLGSYFKELENIRPLKPYEGDTIIEGRYGNSIRFGATTSKDVTTSNKWSNTGEIGNPITILRNGQKGDEQGASFEHIVEDIDNDDSSIYLCSNQQLTNFKPASIYQMSFGSNINAKFYKEVETPDTDIEVNVNTEDISLSSPSVLIPEELQETNLSNLNDLWGGYESEIESDTVGVPLSDLPPILPASYDTTGTGIDLNLELDED